MKRLYGILLALAGALPVLLLAGAVLSGYYRMPCLVKKQPIAYNHKTHIAQGLECGFCHDGIAEGRARAQLPTVAVCATCHTGDDENPGAKDVWDYVSKNKPIPWEKIYAVPDHVYFSHRRHVGLAKLDCAVCHGDMSKAEAPVTKQAVKISMTRCMDCHYKMEATNDCIACHR